MWPSRIYHKEPILETILRDYILSVEEVKTLPSK